VSATDPLSVALAAVALLISGPLAAMVPAWRAARVSPVESWCSDKCRPPYYKNLQGSTCEYS